IAGIIGKADEGLIQSMTRVLAHRGPDGEGYFSSGDVALGHRRLSIIDLETGQQPKTTADGRYTIVFNGEIYNFRELRRELESQGARFRTLSDTEVLLEAYAVWGRASLEKLRGMFAFAVWDAKERRLFAARDRLGVKPFYYAQISEELIFASEMKGLLAHPGVKRELDYPALDDFLTYLYVPAPRTIFRGISELPPAHWLEWQHGRLHVERYWDVEFRPERRDLQDYVEELQQVLSEAVRLRLVSDVPLGVFLSGGLDSSTVAALTARQATEPVRTFTLGFVEGEERFSEWDYARIVSEKIGAQAREFTILARSAELLGTVTRQFDEPFGNPTSILIYQLSEAGRQHVTVALVGDAGDEVFLGYPRYQGAVLAERYRKAPEILRRAIAGTAYRLSEPGDGHHFKRRLREFLTGSCHAPEQMYFEWISYFDREQRQRLYSPELRRVLGERDSSQFLVDLFRGSQASEFVDRINYVDLHSFLPYNLLRYSDRMSMAHGLELRCPYTDHKLLEFLSRIPWRYKLRGNQTKFLLREAARDLLPKRILRRGKLGLNPPMGMWLRGKLRPLLHEYLAPERVQERGYFRSEVVQELIRDHLNRRRDYSLQLWGLISFEEWHRQYLDSIPPTQSAETAKFAYQSSHPA
ncbi:MAG TPA: asparagine synthase (glutamine-hydrolyzing), partial [Candidatus Bathyarchaeia archaeon]|nr:asparagine synthase (glutamine-hydrolyzing) [Candidatus Bathyarchaeia archaeon]